MKLVVLLSGYSKSGKDTAGDIFENFNYVKMSFADALKKQVSDVYRIPIDLMYTHKGKSSKFCKETCTVYENDETLPSIRDILIRHGSEQRKANPDMYASIILEKIRQSESRKFVICDTRFPNEISVLCKEFDVRLVRINRFFKSDVQDQSETALDNYVFDHYIVNHSSLFEFEFDIYNLIFSIDPEIVVVYIDSVTPDNKRLRDYINEKCTMIAITFRGVEQDIKKNVLDLIENNYASVFSYIQFFNTGESESQFLDCFNDSVRILK